MTRRPFVALATAALLAGPAAADTIQFESEPTGSNGTAIGAFAGKLTVVSSTSASAVLAVELTNSTPAVRGGKLTGFVFNAPTGTAVTAVSVASDTHPSFVGVVGSGAAAPPFGNFDFGAALGGDWTGGGSPNAGIAAGATGLFTLTLTGTGLSGLTADSIWYAPETNGPLAVRFKGGSAFTQGDWQVGNDWSDKVLGKEVPGDPPPGNPVPAPSAALLAGLAAVAGLGLRSHRR